MDIYQVIKSNVSEISENSLSLSTNLGFNITLSGKNLPSLQNLPSENLYVLILSTKIYNDIMSNNAIYTLNQILAGEI